MELKRSTQKKDKKRRVKSDADKITFDTLIKKASKPLQSKKKTKA
jgi:hypothetical protein